MTSEMLDDALSFESDESEDGEYDEAFDESDEGLEDDIGEWRRRRRRNRYRQKGVKGVAMRRPDGGVNKLQFPEKLATAGATNRGFNALEEKLARLEKSLGIQQKKNNSVAGLVTLGIGGGLSAYGAVNAQKLGKGTLTLNSWANEPSTKAAALISAGQLATTGAKLVVNGRYQRSGVGMAADIFAAAQIATFALGYFSKPVSGSDTVINFLGTGYAAALAAAAPAAVGDVLVSLNDGVSYRVVEDSRHSKNVMLMS